MLRNKLSFILASSLSLSFVACDDGDDGGDTGAGATESSGTESDTTDTPTTDTPTTDTPTTDGETTDTPTTDDPDTDTSDDSSTTDDSSADPCDDVVCEDGESCVGGICVEDGGETDTAGETDSGGEDGCPAGEMCEMTGAGGMACLGAPSHCVLICGPANPCPDSMECQAGACGYNASMPAEMPDAAYPQPTAAGCEEGFLPASFAMGFAVCIPECDEADMCPAAATGGAVGACAVNPTSSGTPC